MKTKVPLLVISLLLVAFAIKAQGPTLTYSNTAHVPGDVIHVNRITAPGILPGVSGASQTWNFSTLPVGTPVTQNCVNPASTAYAGSFTMATLAMDLGGSSYDFYKINSSSYECVGAANPYYPLVYTNTQIIMTYPFSFGNTINDNFSGTYLYAGDTYYRYGISQTIADGYGSLVLASGFYNVLRIKITQSLKDSSAADGVFFTFQSTGYQWYDGTNKTPLFAITYMAYDAGGMQYDTIISMASSVAGVDKIQEDPNFSICPNPAHQLVHINLNENESSSVVSLYDLQGRLVKSFRDITAVSDQIVLDISDILQGIYFIRIETENRFSTQKLIVY